MYAVEGGRARSILKGGWVTGENYKTQGGKSAGKILTEPPQVGGKARHGLEEEEGKS